MSRLCVNNLPKYLKEETLREHFSQKGEVTDAKIVRTKDGNSRQFGYVGYKTVEDAKAAQKYFHDTFIDTRRISVVPALKVGDSNLPRPWSQHSCGSSAYANIHGKDLESHEKTREKQRDPSKSESIFEKLRNPDPKLQEFLNVHETRTKEKTWSNDAIVNSEKHKKISKNHSGKGKSKVKEDFVESRKHGGKGIMLSRTHVKFDDDGESSDDEYDNNAPMLDSSDHNEEATESVGNATEHQERISDMDWLHQKVSNKIDEIEESDGEKSESESEGEEDEEMSNVNENSEDHVDARDTEILPSVEDPVQATDADELDELFTTHKTKKLNANEVKGGSNNKDHDVLVEGADKDEAVEPVEESGRIFVRNLPYTCTETELRDVFSPYGELTEVHMPIDKTTNKTKGVAFVLFMIPENAKSAMDALDRSTFQGRLMHLMPAKPMPTPKVTQYGKSSYKRRKETERRKEIGREHNWNTLFLRTDTVTDLVADRMGVEKGEILSRDADSIAVRVALGEAHVIAETKLFLEANDVNVSEFEMGSPEERMYAKKERSKTVMLAKNLAPDVTEEELNRLFGRFGTLSRLVVPPSKTIALVEYLEASEARKAFRTLALRNFHHIPLYLEWAPLNSFSSTKTNVHTAPTDTLKGVKPQIPTKGEFYRRLFGAHGELRALTIATKPDPNHKGKTLSLGFGFVEFSRRDDAQYAMGSLQGTVVDGHKIEVKFSDKRLSKTGRDSDQTRGKKPQGGTKLLLRNVPFEASAKEIRELCGTFGQVKSVRLPKKFSGGHRGFAFVDFLTKQEASNAFEALTHAHFYGRHLVIEYAKNEETVSESRDKTKRYYEVLQSDKPRESAKKAKLMKDPQDFEESFE